jgi:hypothetical protein
MENSTSRFEDKHGNYAPRKHLNSLQADMFRQSARLSRMQDKLNVIYIAAMVIVGINLITAAYLLSVLFGR